MTGPHPSVAAVRTAVRAALDDCEIGTRVWVAVSGGPDSLALAAATGFVGRKEGYLTGAIIVDHGLQPDSGVVAERAGATHENENTRPMRIGIDDALAALAAGTFVNAFTVTALQWLALNRGRLGDIARDAPAA